MNKNNPTLLYQFALSHYCEKARWALDIKGVPYQLINLIPGPHLFTTKKLAKQSSVPILSHQGKIIQDSTNIIDYLDEKFPSKPLNPSTPSEKKEALELEEFFDEAIGVHLRRFFYFFVLENRKLVTRLLTQDGPAYGVYLYAIIFPLVKTLMKKSMRINAESAKRSEIKLTKALEKLNGLVSKNDFLVGNKLSRADITAASLLAPLCTPKEHAFPWPVDELMPKSLIDFKKAHKQAPFFEWVLQTYKNHR